MRIDPDFSPIFIVGHPRSGSTLLASLLGSHSKVAAMPETHFVRSSLYGGTPLRRLLASRNLKARMKQLFTNVRLIDIGVTQQDFEAYCQSNDVDPNSPAQILCAFLSLCRERSGKEYIVEKTPGHIVYTNKIHKWLPQAKVIYTIRDARDAVRSLLQVKWTHSNPKRHAAYWAWCVRRALADKASNPDKVHLVRYEDLLSSPIDVMQELCSFIGINYEASMLASERSEEVIPVWESEWKKSSNLRIDQAHANQWKVSADTDLITLVEVIADAEMVRLGYELHDPARQRSLKDMLVRIAYNTFVSTGVYYREYLSRKKNRFRERQIRIHNENV